MRLPIVACDINCRSKNGLFVRHKTRFSIEQIAAVLQQVGGGVSVGDVCRQVGISVQTTMQESRS